MTGAPAVLTRPEAVDEIARCLRDRTHWIVLPPPWLHGEVCLRLRDVPAVVYIDAGLDAILVGDPDLARVAGLLVPSSVALTVTIPKQEVPAATLRPLVGTVPDDGSRDLLQLQDEEHRDQLAWPGLFLDACELVSPGSTEAIRRAAV